MLRRKKDLRILELPPSGEKSADPRHALFQK